MDSDFTKFKKWFRYYQEKFGLLGWKVYFKQEPIEDSFATISMNLGNMVAKVRFNSKDKSRLSRDIKLSAKHESLHLLVGRLELSGKARYITGDEIYESSEELVNKLCELIE